MNTTNDVYSQIGYGKIIAKNFIHKVIGKNLTMPDLTFPVRKKTKQQDSSIIVEGMGNVVVHLAKCCTPLPGEDIMGYISMDRGIVVHRCECNMLLQLNSDRFVEVDWKRAGQEKHQVALTIIVQNHPGVLKEVSNVFTEKGVNILDLNTQASGHLKAQLFFRIEIEDIHHLRGVVRALEDLKIVHNVSREALV